ncbi:MAG: FHA domain-containing protein [Planctomycetaceae bacterium]|nr:FHA domain-containing protein [Planctomycetaceae bacterium]
MPSRNQESTVWQLRVSGLPGPVYLKDAPLVIGRSASEADLILDHSSVSRRHCLLEVREDAVFCRDLCSKNGIFVNGSQMERCLLKAGDRLTIGTFQLLIQNSGTQIPEKEAPSTSTIAQARTEGAFSESEPFETLTIDEDEATDDALMLTPDQMAWFDCDEASSATPRHQGSVLPVHPVQEPVSPQRKISPKSSEAASRQHAVVESSGVDSLAEQQAVATRPTLSRITVWGLGGICLVLILFLQMLQKDPVHPGRHVYVRAVAIHNELLALREAKATEQKWQLFADRVHQELPQLLSELPESTYSGTAEWHLGTALRDFLPPILRRGRMRSIDEEDEFIRHLRLARDQLER